MPSQSKYWAPKPATDKPTKQGRSAKTMRFMRTKGQISRETVNLEGVAQRWGPKWAKEAAGGQLGPAYKKMNPRDVEATRGFGEGVKAFVAPTGVDPVTSRFSVVRSTN